MISRSETMLKSCSSREDYVWWRSLMGTRAHCSGSISHTTQVTLVPVFPSHMTTTRGIPKHGIKLSHTPQLGRNPGLVRYIAQQSQLQGLMLLAQLL
mmetsp:Transcript_5729/g.21719  ORF Transcript_5729/g.21719 Transcript_5729/m.21719 type:complete len:97 (-) Transcript_5729:433-723(-)